MAEIITQKVAIGIGACAFGCPVRYNGHSFNALSMLGRKRADFVFTPVCPECPAGLGVPRAPIHLTGTGVDVLAGRATVRDRRGHDVTAAVVEGCTDAMAALERAGVVAFIAKEASPTCGLAKARVGIRSFMWKTYVHAKKKGRLEGVDLNELTVDSPEVRTNVDSLARELVGLGRISFENDLLFGTGPVIRRDGRRVAARESAASSSPIAPPH